ncbi:hypothetical protein BJV74DRAFT_141881 [Russula compacta]|nr:hypothetical protein BJV74DRAFT_141881 [Russula compacta]
MWERDDRWIALAKDQFGLPEHVLRDNIAHGDNSVLLSILIHVTRQALRSPHDPNSWLWNVLSTISRFDIRHTIPGLQHEFCALWNGIILEARNRGRYSPPVYLLQEIRHAYIALHRGTEAAPTTFSASTDPNDRALSFPLSYPLCTLASHRPDSTHDDPSSARSFPPSLPTVKNVPMLSSVIGSVHTTAQETKETIITPSLTNLVLRSSTRSFLQPFPSASPTTEPIPASRQPAQFTLPATDIVGPDNPTTNINAHSPETRETSHAASASSLSFPHPNPILAAVTPSTVPSAVVSCLADVSDLFQRTTSTATLSHPQENNRDSEYDTGTPSATTYISGISSTTHSIFHSTPGSGTTLERDEEAASVPPIVVSHSQLSPMLMPAARTNVIPESFMESPLIQSDSTLHALRPPSSSATAHSQVALQVTSIFDPHVTGSIRAVPEHDDHGMDTAIPMEDLPRPNRSMVPTPGIDPFGLPPEDGKNNKNQLCR